MNPNRTYRAALGLTILACLLLVWISMGVGIIGADGDPANFLYGGVLLVGLAGALAARFRPAGMAYTLGAMALTQALIAAVAVFGGLGRPWSGAVELVLLNGFFVALFLGAAWLFRQASLRPGPSESPPAS